MAMFNSKLLVITRGLSMIFHPWVHGPPDFGNAQGLFLGTERTSREIHPRCRRVHAPQQATAKEPRVPRVSEQAARTWPPWPQVCSSDEPLVSCGK